ncbi:MAG TPA: Gfo/Idh/MocA family oxidoreductase [Herpetosiphonaceae bacterium]
MSRSFAAQPPLRIGMIGAGKIVERAHLPLLCAMPDVTVAGVFDPQLSRAEALASQFNIPHACAHVEQLLALELDIAVVACPNYLHAPMSIAALEAGLHVLCEKPMATSSADAAAMRAAAIRANRELMIGFPNRFRPEVVALRQAVERGELGDIRSIRCGWLRRSGIPGSGTWFTNRALAGGGALTDLGSHVLDLALWIARPGPVLDVSCTLDRTATMTAEGSWYVPSSSAETGVNDVEISASGFVVCSGSFNLFVETSWACAVPFDQTYLHVYGTRGLARLETVFGFSPSGVRPVQPLQLWIDGKPVEETPPSTPDLLQPYRDQIAFFLDSVRQRQSLRPDLDVNVATVELIQALYAAASQSEET